MATYAEQLQALNAYFDRDDAAMTKIAQAVPAVVADVKFLKDTITKLQNTQGQVTPEDQALIDQLQARANAAATRTEQLAADIKALDDATPPEVPVEPPPPPPPGPTE